MRISDWSSDVCSSDLIMQQPDGAAIAAAKDMLDGGSLVILREERRPYMIVELVFPGGKGPVARHDQPIDQSRDRKSVVSGKSVSVRVDPGGRRIIKKKKTTNESNSRNNSKLKR